jgi:hypothetical protein
MISSGNLSSISHPLPLQFQADPEDGDYTREAKEQAAWEAAAVLEAPVALVSSAMDVQHQSAKRPRSLSEDSLGREGKYQLKHRISKPRLYYYLPTATRRIPTK